MNSPVLAFLSGLLLAAPVAAQQYIIDQPLGGDTFGARSTGQTFTPGIGAVPSPGPSNPVLLLTEITLYHGNFTSANPSTTTYLKIYDGDPQSGGNFLGVSTNAVDTTGLTFHTMMQWDFGQLPLLTTTEYWAVMSATISPTSIDVAEVSLETADRNIASPNAYAGGSGLIANIVKHPNDVDARFEVQFFNGVIGKFTVSGTGCPSSVGLATLSAQSTPRIGQTFQADFGNLSPVGLPYVVFGLSDTNWGPNTLPFPLNALLPSASPTCQILVSPDAPQPLTLNGTAATMSMVIPNSTGFAGLPLFFQGAQIEATGFSLTAKGAMLIGN